MASDEQEPGPPAPRVIDDLFVFDAAAIEPTALTWVAGTETLRIPLPKQHNPDDLSGAWLAPYRIHERLGQGASAVVYRATHEVLKRDVAIKVFSASDPLSQARFLREAQALTRFRHPHLVELYDVGLFGEHPFLVMEFLQGQTLRARIEAAGPLEVEHATVITRQVALALAALHSAGIVHRDVKPANLVLLGDDHERVKLVDLGLVIDEERTRLTIAARFVGTPSYAAPEQASDAPITPAADLYALGATSYAMLIGHPPFIGPGPAKVIEAHRSQIPPPLPLWGPLPTLVTELLAKRPEDRPTALEVIRRLAPPRSSPPPPPSPSRASSTSLRWALVGGAASLVIAGFALRSLVLGASTPAPEVPVPTPLPTRARVIEPPASPSPSAPSPSAPSPSAPSPSAPSPSAPSPSAPSPSAPSPSAPPRGTPRPSATRAPTRSLPPFDRAPHERRHRLTIAHGGLSPASLRADPSYVAWEPRFEAALSGGDAASLAQLERELEAILETPSRAVIERRIEELVAQLQGKQATGLSLDRSNELSARIIDLRVANARAAPKDRAALAARTAEISRQIAEE